jgi:hypothetical protein
MRDHGAEEHRLVEKEGARLQRAGVEPDPASADVALPMPQSSIQVERLQGEAAWGKLRRMTARLYAYNSSRPQPLKDHQTEKAWDYKLKIDWKELAFGVHGTLRLVCPAIFRRVRGPSER